STFHPAWYVDHVDGSALAADYYLLDWMASGGDAEAQHFMARWLPQIADYFARIIDLIIGLELGHYERAPRDVLPSAQGRFLAEITQASSSIAWADYCSTHDYRQALALASAVF